MRNILILRTNAGIGDCILFTGPLHALRRTYPDDKLTLAVPQSCMAIFECCPDIDKLISVESLLYGPAHRLPSCPGKRRIGRMMRKALPKPHYSLVICPQKSLDHAVYEITSCVTADRWIVSGSGDTCSQSVRDGRMVKALGLDFQQGGQDKWEHELIHYSWFLGRSSSIVPRLSLTYNELVWAERVWQRIERVDRPRLVVSPGAKDPIRQWPIEYWLDTLSEVNATTIVIGTKAQHEMCSRLPGANLAGRTSIREFMSIMARADAFVGCDSGPLHVANALDIPAVGIVGGGHYGRFYPATYAQNDHPVSHKMDCYHCNWQCIYDEPYCITRITPEQVLSVLQETIRSTNHDARF